MFYLLYMEVQSNKNSVQIIGLFLQVIKSYIL